MGLVSPHSHADLAWLGGSVVSAETKMNSRWHAGLDQPATPIPPTTTICVRCRRSAEFLGEPDEKSFGPPDVAEPIHVFILDHFADELRAALAESGERLVDIVHGEHHA